MLDLQSHYAQNYNNKGPSVSFCSILCYQEINGSWMGNDLTVTLQKRQWSRWLVFCCTYTISPSETVQSIIYCKSKFTLLVVKEISLESNHRDLWHLVVLHSINIRYGCWWKDKQNKVAPRQFRMHNTVLCSQEVANIGKSPLSYTPSNSNYQFNNEFGSVTHGYKA